MLEEHKSFDQGLFSLLEGFLERLPPPVCLLAHNGLRFDFPILAREVSALGQVNYFLELHNTYSLGLFFTEFF